VLKLDGINFGAPRIVRANWPRFRKRITGILRILRIFPDEIDERNAFEDMH